MFPNIFSFMEFSKCNFFRNDLAFSDTVYRATELSDPDGVYLGKGLASNPTAQAITKMKLGLL